MKKLFYFLTLTLIIYSCNKNELESISEEIGKNKQYDTIFINNGDTLKMYKKDIKYNIFYDEKTGKYYDTHNKNQIPFFGEWKLYSQGKQIRLGDGIKPASDDFIAYDEIHFFNDINIKSKLGVHCYIKNKLQKEYYYWSFHSKYILYLGKYDKSNNSGINLAEYVELLDTHFKADTLIINCVIKNKSNQYENIGLKYLKK